MRKYSIAVVIGRLQPLHNIHYKLIKKALELGDDVLILLGSAKKAPDPRNPFSAEMREEMMRLCFTEEENSRITCHPVRDHIYNNNIWLAEVQQIVRDFQEQVVERSEEEYTDAQYNARVLGTTVALVGHIKDATSEYLKQFPQWKYESYYLDNDESDTLNATDIRALYFEGKDYSAFVPKPVAEYLSSIRQTTLVTKMVSEHEYIEKYKKDSRFVGMPFEPTFVTTDAVVVCNGHVLLIRRGFNPSAGLLALAGGFLHPELTTLDNAIKELREETKIRMSADALKSCLKGSHVFDYPLRSLRGRTVTHAFLFEIEADGYLPTVSRKGGDDAVGAFWMPISAIQDYEEEFMEDHLEILNFYLRGTIKGE